MSLKDKIAAVAAAEARYGQVRDEADAAVGQLKAEVRRGATPVRIVVSGLALGFASGITPAGGAAAAGGKFITGPLFSLVMDSVIPGVLAGFTAAASASEEIEEAAEVAVDEAIDEATESAGEDTQAPPARPKRKRRESPRGRASA